MTAAAELCLQSGLTPDLAALAAEAGGEAWALSRLAALDAERVRADVAYWLTNYVWTCDTRDMDVTGGTDRPPAVRPFAPFPRQVAFLNWLEERERLAAAGANGGGLVDKSRDSGISWLACAFGLHRWLFRSHYAVGYGSRKLELVDNRGDMKTLFEKIRFMLYRLPPWMLPRGFRRHEHDAEAKLINPENGSTITGEGGDEIGRGDRQAVYFVDEAAYLKHPKLVEASLSQTTRCRIDISTHNGPGTVFYEKEQSGRVSVFVFDWKDDPRKNRTETMPDGRVVYPWYEGEKKRLDPVTLAQEVDRDPTASLEGIAIPGVWVRAAVNFEIPGLPEAADVWGGLDVGGGTLPTTFLAVRRGPVLLPLKQYTGPNTTAITWNVRDDAHTLGVQSLAFEHTGVGVSIKGTWESAEDAQKPTFDVRALNTGSPASRDPWPDGKPACEKFLNLRAEAWWGLRERFRKTYEYSIGQETYAPEELISIPPDVDLVAQLSSPKAQPVASGKLKVESKKDMRGRGVKSPDRADSVVLCFYEGGRSVYETADLLVF